MPSPQLSHSAEGGRAGGRAGAGPARSGEGDDAEECRRGAAQQAELLAFAWVGQGTYDAADWDEAIEEASAVGNVAEELMEMPMLASVLESGMAAFDLSCNGIGEMS